MTGGQFGQETRLQDPSQRHPASHSGAWLPSSGMAAVAVQRVQVYEVRRGMRAGYPGSGVFQLPVWATASAVTGGSRPARMDVAAMDWTILLG
jgi:hypothetical protein